MPEKKPVVFLALSLDVEEEGLFCGHYRQNNPPVTNTRHLRRLLPLLERGVKPTLFCAYSVLVDAESRKILEDLRDRHGAEIGAHLHHWSTPPILPQANADSSGALRHVYAKDVDLQLMAAKMSNLFKAARDFQGAPVTSFRMGRWDFLRDFWGILRQNGVLCDASVRPLHSCLPHGPDHFDAPADPYLGCPPEIMEVPLTVTPVVPALSQVSWPIDAICQKYRSSLRKWGALALLPVEHPLWLMKITTILHMNRGGKTLSLTWHSSEMMPGGSPRMRDEAAVQKFMNKMAAYIDWLMDTFSVTFATMSCLRQNIFPTLSKALPARSCDWRAGRDWRLPA